jgi:hypothetical protein
MKKFFVAIGILVALAIAAMTIAPLFFDINKKIKPILVSALEKNLGARVHMGNISLSLYGQVTFKVDSLKIVKDKLTAEISDLSMMMPYSVLRKNPTQWMKNIRMQIIADEISLNSRQLVVKDLKTDLLKEESVIKLKNTEFHVFEGKGKSYAQLEFDPGVKGLFEFEIQDGVWPVDKLKDVLKQKVSNIPKAQDIVSKVKIDDRFETLKGKVSLANGTTNIESLLMTMPKNKTEIKGSGFINPKNDLKINGNIILPLENVPAELKDADGRGDLPLEILGTLDNPQVNWEKTIQIVVRAYSKDEGKKIIKEQVNKLKEKLMKDEKIKDFIKGIKF